MNTKMQTLAKWMGAIVTVGVVLLLVVIFSDRPLEQRPAETVAPGLVPTDIPVGQSASALPSRETVVPVPTAPEPVVMMHDNGGSAAKMVRVKADQTLATVNGVAITLKDLMPLPEVKAGQAQTLSAERYGFLLDRAVEREVTFQTAQAQGVALTKAQRQRVEEMRVQSDRTEPGVFDTVQQNPVNTEFAVRDATGLLLQATLAETAGVPSPHVTPAQVQAYYQQHHAEYGTLPAEAARRNAVWERIDRDIRLKLAEQGRAEHQARFQQFRDQLRTDARIVLPAT
jgi:hypothetical protein